MNDIDPLYQKWNVDCFALQTLWNCCNFLFLPYERCNSVMRMCVWAVIWSRLALLELLFCYVTFVSIIWYNSFYDSWLLIQSVLLLMFISRYTFVCRVCPFLLFHSFNFMPDICWLLKYMILLTCKLLLTIITQPLCLCDLISTITFFNILLGYS
jgi:hypothetical protein